MTIHSIEHCTCVTQGCAQREKWSPYILVQRLFLKGVWGHSMTEPTFETKSDVVRNRNCFVVLKHVSLCNPEGLMSVWDTLPLLP